MNRDKSKFIVVLRPNSILKGVIFEIIFFYNGILLIILFYISAFAKRGKNVWQTVNGSRHNFQYRHFTKKSKNRPNDTIMVYYDKSKIYLKYLLQKPEKWNQLLHESTPPRGVRMTRLTYLDQNYNRSLSPQLVDIDTDIWALEPKYCVDPQKLILDSNVDSESAENKLSLNIRVHTQVS